MASQPYLKPTARALFISGTGTSVGKTFVAGSLLEAAHHQHLRWSYWKPVQTGYPDCDTSTIVRQLAEAECLPEPAYVFRKPASPDQAARHEGLPAPQLSELTRTWQNLTSQQPDQTWLVEGAGGLMVPLNDKQETWLDWLSQTNMPILLVATSGLGTLNHTALSIETIRLRGLELVGVVLNGPEHADNLDTLCRWFPEVTFWQLEQQAEDEQDQPFPAGRTLFQQLQQHWQPEPPKATPPWVEWDHQHCWHPYTQHKLVPKPPQIVRAQGVWLTTQDGQNLLDGISSWWANTIGHGQPAIGEAMARQQRKLDHVIFAGATHEPAARLSKRLSELTQNHLSRVFYTDNGSCAVEVALKIALQSWTNQDRKRHRRVLSFHGSYHGDTFGTMAAAAAEPFHGAFRDLMFQPLTAAPATLHPTAFNPVGKGMLDQRCNELKNLFERYHDDLGAVILEPMLQGASGMNVQDPVWLRLLDQLCHDYEIPLILDEVFTGMGRSADYFAFHREHLHPDIVCIAKGLTGGTLPLAATLVTEDLFENFYSDDRRKALYHGHTFTANAIACAAALATLELYGQKQLISRARQLETRFQSWLRDHQDDLGLAHPRSYGAVMAWEVAGSGPKDYFSQLALRVPQLAEAHGLWLRPLGNTIYFAPPLTITDEELDFALDGLRQVMTTLRS